jgi:hypothetical protein
LPFACGAQATLGNEHSKMALHRDVYWVGRQWAVTGSGIQACDQRQKSQFDIEASRLWEDGVLEGMRALAWLNIEDFEKALSVARQRYPEPFRKAVPLEESASGSQDRSAIELPRPAAQKFNMRVEGWPARFVRPWRIRIKR